MGITGNRIIALALALAALSTLSACDGSRNLLDRFNLRGGAEDAPEAGTATRTVEEDVEAPEVFSATGEGLWDGRPSLGGIWVAHPDVAEPERVMIRNTGNGRSVTGALFRREREVPGPELQVSSDAAEALGLVAGQPQELEVTALRRREVPAPERAETGAMSPPEEVTESTLDPVAIETDAIYSAPDAGTGAQDTD